MTDYTECTIATVNISECALTTVSIAECSPPGTTKFIDEGGGETEVDQQGPIISSVHAETIGANSIILDWWTDEPGNSQVIYSTQSTHVPGFVNGETLTPYIYHNRAYSLAGLLPFTKYYFRPVSKDSYDNGSSGGMYSFKTATDTNLGIAPKLEV